MGEIRVLIVDYGMGNIGSMVSAASSLNVDHFVSSDRCMLARADAIILPGVGAFSVAMENLLKLNLVDELAKQVLVKKKPFLGVCLGMQLLARESAEQGPSQGLDWIDGKVVKLLPGDGLRVPHVGWNEVHPLRTDLLFEDVGRNRDFYFDHSYHLQCAATLVTATCEYGSTMVAAIRKDNIFGNKDKPT